MYWDLESLGIVLSGSKQPERKKGRVKSLETPGRSRNKMRERELLGINNILYSFIESPEQLLSCFYSFRKWIKKQLQQKNQHCS